MLGRDDATLDQWVGAQAYTRYSGTLSYSAGDSGSSISSALAQTTDRRALTICPEPPETHIQETESHRLGGAY